MVVGLQVRTSLPDQRFSHVRMLGRKREQMAFISRDKVSLEIQTLQKTKFNSPRQGMIHFLQWAYRVHNETTTLLFGIAARIYFQFILSSSSHLLINFLSPACDWSPAPACPPVGTLYYSQA